MKSSGLITFLLGLVATLVAAEGPSTLQQQLSGDEARRAAETDKMLTMLSFAMGQTEALAANSTAAADDELFMEHTMEAQRRKDRPTVWAFRKNIYTEQYYTDSVYSSYVDAFFLGYNLASYNDADECRDNSGLFMNSIHEFYLNVTRKRDYTDPYNLIFETAGNGFNDAWYNCYNFGIDIKQDYEQRFNSFQDFGDLYLSFIFNMLSNSLTIRTQTNNMITAYDTHDTYTFTQSLASILRSILVFESYNEDAGSLSMNPTFEEFLGLPKQRKLLNKEQRAAQRAENTLRAEEKLVRYREEREAERQARYDARRRMLNAGSRSVAIAEDYEWGVRDYVQSPLAFLIGSLHALPQTSNGPKCSSNSTEFRAYLIESVDYFDIEEQVDGARSLYEGLSYIDEVGIYCHDAITEDLSASHFSQLATDWTFIPVNLLYNAGYMWVDVVNYQFYTPETVPDNDWGFFVVYLLGDFIMRIFYHDNTPQDPDSYQ